MIPDALGDPRQVNDDRPAHWQGRGGSPRGATFGERRRPVVAEALAHRAQVEPSGRYAGQAARLAAQTAAFAAPVLGSALALRPPG